MENEQNVLESVDKLKSSSYTVNKIKKRKDLEKAKKEDAIKIILESVEYYNEEYPNSTRGIEWTKAKIPIRLEKIDDIDDFLEKCSEEDLFGIRDILKYAQKEVARKVKLRDRYDLVIVRVKKRIPGIKYVERLEKIKEKEAKIVKERKDYELLIQEARQDFEANRLEVFNKPMEEVIEEEVEPLEPYFCSICARNHTKGQIYQDHLEYKV